MSFLRQYFYAFILTFFVLYFSLLAFHAMHYSQASPAFTDFMTAMMDNEKLVIGALLGLITGHSIAVSGNGKPPAPPAVLETK